MTEETNKGGMVEGIALSGSEVAKLTDKHFCIVAVPEYIEIPDFKDNTKTVRKLKLVVELAENKVRTEYYPNKTSVDALVQKFGRVFGAWISGIAEFFIADQMVNKEMRSVIYVK